MLLLLPSSVDKLLVKWQGPYEAVKCKGEAAYDIRRLPGCGSKRYHVNLLKGWQEDEEQEAFFGLDVDWDEEGNWRTELLHQQMDEGIPVSAWQTQQISQVVASFPDILPETPRTAWSMQHHIKCPQGW